MRIGVIADDFTGASDIAGFLVAGGMQTVMYNGIPTAEPPKEVEALVISLKIRSVANELAVSEALKSLAFLQSQGCTKFYYKYCSTFDSTAEGTIGPVIDALLDALGSNFTIICPSLPVNGRTVCHGYLFVDDTLLSESPMRYHPITPMTDSKLERLMATQCSGTVGNVFYPTIARGTKAVAEEFENLLAQGHRYAVVDTLHNQDLLTIAEASASLPLVTGGSGLAIGITEAVKGKVDSRAAAFLPPENQKAVVISGSCSARTNEQVAHYREIAPSKRIDEASALQDPAGYGKALAAWVFAHQESAYAPLLYATRTPEELAGNAERFEGADLAGVIEATVASAVAHLAAGGVEQYIVAGGETSGVVATTLGIQAYRIGIQIDPGVSWLQALESSHTFTFKSGNFGTVDFFTKAQDLQKEGTDDAYSVGSACTVLV